MNKAQHKFETGPNERFEHRIGKYFYGIHASNTVYFKHFEDRVEKTETGDYLMTSDQGLARVLEIRKMDLRLDALWVSNVSFSPFGRTLFFHPYNPVLSLAGRQNLSFGNANYALTYAWQVRSLEKLRLKPAEATQTFFLITFSKPCKLFLGDYIFPILEETKA